MSNKNNENLSPTSFEASTDVDLLDYETAFKDLVEQDPQLQALIEEAKHLQAAGKIEEMEGYVGSGGDKDVIAYNGMALKLKRSEARRDIAKQVEPLLEGKGVAISISGRVFLYLCQRSAPNRYIPNTGSAYRCTETTLLFSVNRTIDSNP